MNKKICVFCSSSEAIDKEYFTEAETLGKQIALNGDILVYGGANVGLMRMLAESVKKNNGKVIGVIPTIIKDKNLAFTDADELIVTKDLRERKATMDAMADAFIALPGGFGTLEEILEIITLKQLAVHTKPIVFINTRGFYTPLMKVFDLYYTEKFAKAVSRDFYFMAENTSEALHYIENYTHSEVENKWFEVQKHNF